MAAPAEAFVENEFIPLLPDGARWGDISDVEEDEPAAAADGQDEFETDPKRLTARQQQIDFGKNTLGYERYLQAVPKHKRKLRGKDHDPPTPDITQKMSKRTWDGIVKAWRRHLHKFDNVEVAEAAAAGNGNTGGAADMQVDAAPAVPDAPRAAANPAGRNNRWRANKRRGSKQQSSSSSHHMRQDDTASQQQQEQLRPAAKQDTAQAQQQQQQADDRCRQQSSHNDSRREDSGRARGSRGSAARSQQHRSSSRHDSGSWNGSKGRNSRRAAAGEYSADHEREHGQPPRHNSSTATRSSQDRRHGSGLSRGSGGHKSGSHMQQQQQREARGMRPCDAAAAGAAEVGRRTPDSVAAAGDLAGGSSRQLTPAKRGSNSQGDVDTRPPKHC